MDGWDEDELEDLFNPSREPFEPPALADIPENVQLRQQADAVIEGFRRLTAECEFHSPSTPVDLDIDRLRSKKYLLTELSSRLLPLLDHQTSGLLIPALDRSNLRTDTASKLAVVLELQSQIGQTLDQTIRTMDDFIPGRVPKPNQTNDKHFKEFKSFRLHGLDVAVREGVKSHLTYLFQASRKVIEELKIPTKTCPSDVSSATALNKINSAIRWAKSSELQLILELWQNSLHSIDESLEKLTTLTIPTCDSGGEMITILGLPATQLARSLLPTFRLTKLLFDKLFREGIHRNQPHLFTLMSSDQLKRINELVNEISKSILYLYEEVDRTVIPNPDDHPDDIVYPAPRSQTGRYINYTIKELRSHFQAFLALVSFHIVPFLPHINDLPAQFYFQDWFDAWSTLFSSITCNAIQASNIFALTDPD
ncbi:hypothetical protein MJO28_011657 [Puccinia striiformis f. sp. tritici]|uniref:Uncharacterized protein n=3 Tax=Puccinia striiformis TaxID=27350 RepID=A0A0L0UYV5_9BASI|nr:hypothetical protein Pst134EA_021240 [Puccinia striiformis f. sp. tritici]KAI9614730.1 hypothetical protein H4Q26_009121 [Puccinia striiformis f. sp. tritici PST-130]KNE92228.1 hypothetical protein PSTG_14398 [Puccinia striiformis f. sp. tritici PST-78]POW08126.1 hypothetical protein PSTT_07749 [Puccinia striiformis]KAH9448104.1 hypothetical protein Pst134EB_022091 [Puccinia striiformis f. sp. tritici]KAH9448120.1 hypothetical protein Pst134EB_022106 [Puccinia striiformis f. sp. tritici]